MRYKLLLSKQVSKFFKSRNKFEKTLITLKFELLRNSPFPSGNLDIKAMKGHSNIYRLRVLDYRFIYEVKDNEVLILVFKARSRGDVYK